MNIVNTAAGPLQSAALSFTAQVLRGGKSRNPRASDFFFASDVHVCIEVMLREISNLPVGRYMTCHAHSFPCYFCISLVFDRAAAFDLFCVAFFLICVNNAPSLKRQIVHLYAARCSSSTCSVSTARCGGPIMRARVTKRPRCGACCSSLPPIIDHPCPRPHRHHRLHCRNRRRRHRPAKMQ